MVNDPIADLLTRIRNACMVQRSASGNSQFQN